MVTISLAYHMVKTTRFVNLRGLDMSLLATVRNGTGCERGLRKKGVDVKVFAAVGTIRT